jgi:hypothetical protein
MVHLFILTYVRYRTATVRGVQVARCTNPSCWMEMEPHSLLYTVYQIIVCIVRKAPVHICSTCVQDGRCRHEEATGQTDARLPELRVSFFIFRTSTSTRNRKMWSIRSSSLRTWRGKGHAHMHIHARMPKVTFFLVMYAGRVITDQSTGRSFVNISSYPDLLLHIHVRLAPSAARRDTRKNASN